MNADPPKAQDLGLARLLGSMNHTIKGHVVGVIGEFVGTFFFLFLAFSGTQTANVASNTNTGTTVITTVAQKNPSQLLYIALAFGFSLAANAWVFARISGGLFNPAAAMDYADMTVADIHSKVTLGMVLIGAVTWVRGILLFLAQMVGAIVAAFVVQALFTGDLNVDTTLATTTTKAQGVIIEMLLTTQLVFTIFLLAAEKHVGNFIAPVGIGLSLFIAELTGVFWTGGSLNPARSFAPSVAVANFKAEQWVYWVGPLAGSVLAVILLKLIKALEYQSTPVEDASESLQPAAPPTAELHRHVQGHLD